MIFSKVQELCLSKGITIGGLEKELHLGNGTIRKWNKSYPSADKILKVANYFEVSTDFLLGIGKQVSEDGVKVAMIYDNLSKEKQDLLRCYISVIGN